MKTLSCGTIGATDFPWNVRRLWPNNLKAPRDNYPRVNVDNCIEKSFIREWIGSESRVRIPNYVTPFTSTAKTQRKANIYRKALNCSNFIAG